MFIGSWRLSAPITFVCNTHNPTTGAASAADSSPAYRVYEDQTATPLLTGTMATLDSGNTTGYYSASITASTGNGFEQGKSYTIYISATVAGVTATLSRYFQIGAAADLTWMLGTLLTETSGQLAAGFKKWFDVAAPTGTVNSIPNVTAGAGGGLSVVGSAMTLTSGERNSIADAYLDRADAIETGLTPRQATRLAAASDAGVTSGGATTTFIIRNAVANSKNRVTATVDSDGNRSVVTTDVT